MHRYINALAAWLGSASSGPISPASSLDDVHIDGRPVCQATPTHPRYHRKKLLGAHGLHGVVSFSCSVCHSVVILHHAFD